MLPSCRNREPEAGKVTKYFGQTDTASMEPAWREENMASQAGSYFSSHCCCSSERVSFRRDVEGQYTLRHRPFQVSCGALPAVSDRWHLYCSITFLFTHLHACVCTQAHAEIRLAGRQFSPSAHIGPEAGTQVVRFGDSAITHWAISPALCTVLRHRYRDLYKSPLVCTESTFCFR